MRDIGESLYCNFSVNFQSSPNEVVFILSETVIFALQILISVLFTCVLKGDSATVFRNEGTWARGGSPNGDANFKTSQAAACFSGKSLELWSHLI